MSTPYTPTAEPITRTSPSGTLSFTIDPSAGADFETVRAEALQLATALFAALQIEAIINATGRAHE